MSTLLRLQCAGLVCALCFSRDSPDARDLIRRSVEAERENRRRMVNYLFSEQITRRSYDRDGTESAVSRTEHEVVFIGGRPAFRRTSINGRPLTPDEEQAEFARLRQLAEDRKNDPQGTSPADDHRRAHPLPRYLDLTEFQLAGEETVDQRLCWVVDARPKRKARPQNRDDRAIVNSTSRIWIDQQTLHRVKMEVTALKPSEPSGVRESTRYQWAQRDGSVWLVTSITAVLPLRGRAAYQEAEQRYSRYRRFTTESTLSAIEEVRQQPDPADSSRK